MFFILALLLVFVIIVLFAFPRFSPIPYFPSNKKDLKLIVKALKLRNDQTVIDLGAGDGMVIFAAGQEAYQKKLNTYFIAVEINPILLLIMHICRLLHPNKHHIKIVYGNMFDFDFQTFGLSNLPTFYLYISPWYIEKTLINIKKQFDHFLLVSYMYPMQNRKSKDIIKGKRHPVFIYKI